MKYQTAISFAISQPQAAANALLGWHALTQPCHQITSTWANKGTYEVNVLMLLWSSGLSTRIQSVWIRLSHLPAL